MGSTFRESRESDPFGRESYTSSPECPSEMKNVGGLIMNGPNEVKKALPLVRNVVD